MEGHTKCCLPGLFFKAAYLVLDNQLGSSSLGKTESSALKSHQLLTVLHLRAGPCENSQSVLAGQLVLLFRSCLGNSVSEISLPVWKAKSLHRHIVLRLITVIFVPLICDVLSLRYRGLL